MRYIINDFEDYIKGRETPPNLQPVNPGLVLGADLHHVTHLGWLKEKDSLVTQFQARYFLRINQGGAYTGEGLVLYSRWSQGRQRLGCERFALCNHVKVLSPRANPQRGWYPGKCSKCGLDMTVDSGD